MKQKINIALGAMKAQSNSRISYIGILIIVFHILYILHLENFIQIKIEKNYYIKQIYMHFY